MNIKNKSMYNFYVFIQLWPSGDGKERPHTGFTSQTSYHENEQVNIIISGVRARVCVCVCTYMCVWDGEWEGWMITLEDRWLRSSITLHSHRWKASPERRFILVKEMLGMIVNYYSSSMCQPLQRSSQKYLNLWTEEGSSRLNDFPLLRDPPPHHL